MKKIEKPKKQNSDFSVSLVIPVFNNAPTIAKQLTKCIAVMKSYSEDFEIIISDDKSGDNSKEYLTKYSNNSHFRLYYQKRNLGIAQNIFFLYKKTKKSFVVLFSVDGDWEPTDIGRLIDYAQKTNADIVIGKREKTEFSFVRRIISSVYNILPLLLFQVNTYDTGSIKLFRKEIFDKFPLYLQSVSFESEMIIRASKNGYAIRTIPVIYKKQKTDRKSGVNWQVVILSFIDLVQLRLRNI